MSDLTSFQTETVKAVTELLAAHGRQAEHELREGVVPFYSREPVTCAKLLSGDIEVWIFEDGVTFRGGERGGTYERPDFDSEDALRGSLSADLAAILERP